ncbi:hypothetical protein pdam_00024213, partial [Pocillopora damicornis]
MEPRPSDLCSHALPLSFRELDVDPEHSSPKFVTSIPHTVSHIQYLYLFSVPSGCVTPGEYVLQMSVMAAPWHTSQEDFESKPDRCFWSDGWDTRRRNMMTAICYYSKDSVCYQYRGAKINIPQCEH